MAGGRPDRGPFTGEMKESDGQGEKKSTNLSFYQTQAKTVCRWEAAVQPFYKQSTQNTLSSGDAGQATGKQSGEKLPLQASTPWPCPGGTGVPSPQSPVWEAERLPDVNTHSAQEATDKKETQCPKYNF